MRCSLACSIPSRTSNPRSATPALRGRVVRRIEREFCNERRGACDNLSLWGTRDERSSSDGNVLAILEGAVPASRALATGPPGDDQAAADACAAEQ